MLCGGQESRGGYIRQFWSKTSHVVARYPWRLRGTKMRPPILSLTHTRLRVQSVSPWVEDPTDYQPDLWLSFSGANYTPLQTQTFPAASWGPPSSFVETSSAPHASALEARVAQSCQAFPPRLWGKDERREGCSNAATQRSHSSDFVIQPSSLALVWRWLLPNQVRGPWCELDGTQTHR